MDIHYHWYHRSLTFVSWILLPFSYLFRSIVAFRRWLFHKGILKSHAVSVPVIIVGNISVGGTGKTPTVIWLANFLRSQGYLPGIVSRGHGGSHKGSVLVDDFSHYKLVGDEAILLHRHANCSVMVNKDRVQAAKDLISQRNCNIIVSDDGMQNYRLKRAVEIAVVDNARRFGNGELLPAGPLREPTKRLNEVDFVFSHPFSEKDEYAINYISKNFRSVKDEKISQPLDYFANKKVHAIVAIGNPQRFFKRLKSLGVDVIEHIFSDHYQFKQSDIFFEDDLPILMTEKDAVKCIEFANEKHWYLPVELEVAENAQMDLLKKLGEL